MVLDVTPIAHSEAHRGCGCGAERARRAAGTDHPRQGKEGRVAICVVVTPTRSLWQLGLQRIGDVL